MNSKALLIVILAAVAYGGFIAAHKRFDQRTGPVSPEEHGFDASPLIAKWMLLGQDSVEAISAELAVADPESQELIALLPKSDEAWFLRSQEIAKAGAPKAAAGKLMVIFPQGRQVESPRTLKVSRDGTGSAWVRVLAVKDGNPKVEMGGFKIQVNVPQVFPETMSFSSGQSYQLMVADSETAKSRQVGSFSILNRAEIDRVKKAMSILRKHVHEVRPRLYLQASVAMSWGLHDNAQKVLDRLPRHSQGVVELGLTERLIFLAERRNNMAFCRQMLRLQKQSR